MMKVKKMNIPDRNSTRQFVGVTMIQYFPQKNIRHNNDVYA